LLDSHDMARFVTLSHGDQSALQLATWFQMTYTGAPSIYYGDEVGMAGGHDPANRGAFPWHAPETWDTDLLHEFQRLIALRRARPALRRGSFRFLYAQDQVVAYARELGDETVVVALNASRSNRRIDVSLQGSHPDGTILEEPWSNRSVRLEQGMLRGLELRPRSGLILASPALRTA
ncbi:MAG: alpha-amylase family glycosyl hydrolase, partial [Isosphaeraceae bacterium]